MQEFDIGAYLTQIGLVDLLGWLGAITTLAAYSMRTMLAFRVIALAANALLAVYSLYVEIYPTLALNGVLVAMNIARLIQIHRDLRRARRMSGSGGDLLGAGDDWLGALKPLMKEVRLADGTELFARGDTPDRVYLIVDGAIHLPEIGKILGPGELVGEIGFFTVARQRTQTALCAGPCRLLAADEDTFIKAYYQSPELGIAVMRLITSRLSERALADPAPDGGAA